MRTIPLLTLIFTLFTLTGYSNLNNLRDTSKVKPCDYKKYYYDNGKVKEEGCLVNGKKEGEWKEYNANDGRKTEFIYNNGIKNGKYIAYFPNNKINAIGYFKNGSLSDTLTKYDEKGQLISKSVWMPNDNKSSKIIWMKTYIENAKPNGTIEKINGKVYIWQLGEKVEVK